MGLRGDPHNNLVCSILSQPKYAAAYLKWVLPEVEFDVHLDQLDIQSTDFINDQLEPARCDLLYRAPLKRFPEEYCLFLLEHQSTIDRWLPLRIMAYQGLIWQRLRKQAEAKTSIPPIVCCCLYQGPTPWSQQHIHQLFPARSTLLQYFSPKIPLLLTDLSQYSEEDFLPSPLEPLVPSLPPLLRLTLLLLKFNASTSIGTKIIDWLPLWRRAILEGRELMRPLYTYLLRHVPAITRNDIEKMFSSLGTEKETPMSWESEVRLEQSKKIVFALLENKFGEVSLDVKTKLDRLQIDEIEKIILHCATLSSPDELLS